MIRDSALIVAGAVLGLPVGVAAILLHGVIYRPKAIVRIGTPSRRGLGADRGRRLVRRLRGKGPPPEIVVCTDGSFIDTCVFFLAVDLAAAHLPETELTFRQVDWNELAHWIDRPRNVIAYLNRRLLPQVTRPIKVWSNLESFRGHALIGRRRDFPEEIKDLKSANQALDRLAEKGPLTIMCFGGESSDLLRSPLTPLFNSDRVVFDSRSADHALKRFLLDEGDLLLASLPQRLKCGRMDNLVEVMSSQTNPLFFGIDALVYDGDGIGLEVMEAISASWSRLCRRLAASEKVCRAAYRKWLSMAKALEIGEVQFTEDDFVLVMHREPGKYLLPYCGRDDAALELDHGQQGIRRRRGSLRPIRSQGRAEVAVRDLYGGRTHCARLAGPRPTTCAIDVFFFPFPPPGSNPGRLRRRKGAKK